MKLAILDDYQRAALDSADWSPLRGAAEITVLDRHFGGIEAVAAALREFEILCIMRERTPFPRALLGRLPRLRLLVTTGARNDAVDLEAAAERGVTVCGTASTARTTVEHTWALILAAARHVAHEDRRMREGKWRPPSASSSPAGRSASSASAASGRRSPRWAGRSRWRSWPGART